MIHIKLSLFLPSIAATKGMIQIFMIVSMFEWGVCPNVNIELKKVIALVLTLTLKKE